MPMIHADIRDDVRAPVGRHPPPAGGRYSRAVLCIGLGQDLATAIARA